MFWLTHGTLAATAALDPLAPKIDRFELRSRLGEGASGVVYEAIDRTSGARVALKTLRNTDPETLRTLKNEFRTIQGLQHPNLVQPLELFEDGGHWYLTMEFVAGTDFIRYVRPAEPTRRVSDRPSASTPPGGGALHEFRLRGALSQLATGLTALHDAHKIHMDIKPSNVLVTPKGRVVVVDFGITRDLVTAHRDGDAMRGTVAYMAPEQVAGDPIGPAADWYAVGVMLFFALTGAMPIDGNGMDVLAQKLEVIPPRARTIAPEVPEDLDALCADLLAIDPADRPTGRDVLVRLGVDLESLEPASQRSGTVFVGRNRELAALNDAFVASRSGAVAVLVEGSSGLGKSAVVRRFLDSVAGMTPAPLVLQGRCYERESTPYKGMDGALDELALTLREMPPDDVAALRPPDADLLAQVFPVLAEVLQVEVTGAAPLNPVEARARVFAAVRALLGLLAREGPLILAIDDLQWADADSLALLAELLRPPDSPGVLFIATCRTSDGDTDTFATLPGDVRRVRVGKLADGDAKLLVASLLDLGGGTAPGDLASMVSEADGHPLFLEEIVRERARLGPGAEVLRLDDALFARIRRLDPLARRLLEVVCVAGAPTEVDVIARTIVAPLGDVFRVTAALRGAHFVAASAVRRDDVLAPYHDRVRQCVMLHLDPSAKRDWHGRLALALESTTEADPEVLAVQWQGAGNTERAAIYAVRAAERATRALAFERAVHFYELALSFQDPASKTADDLRAALADALGFAGRGAEAAAVRLDLAGRRPTTMALDLRRRAAEELLLSGHVERGAEVLHDALRAAGIWAPRSPFAVIVGLLTLRAILLVRGLSFRERSPSAIDPARLVKVDTVFSAGAGYASTDNVRGAYFLARALLLALRTGDLRRIAIAMAYEASFSSSQGSRSLARTEALVAETARLAERVDTPRARAVSDTAAAYRDYFMGQWRAAADHLARAEAVLRDECVGVQLELNPTRIMLYRTLGYLGDLDDLRARVPPALREAYRLGDVNMQRNIESGPVVLLALADDDPAEAARAAATATAKLERGRFLIQSYLCVVADVQIALYRGHGREAERRIREAWPSLRRSLLLRVQVIRGWALDLRARASIAAALQSTGGERDALLDRAAADAASLAREKLPWCAALAGALRGCLADARGDGATAQARFGEAAASLEAAHMVLHAAAARTRMRAATNGEAELEARGEKNASRFGAMLLPRR